VPNDPDFQRRVLTNALELFNSDSGPVLMDHPEDVPTIKGPDSLVSPASISMSESDEADTAKLAAKLLEEIALIRPWYDRSVESRKRTTVGVSGMDPETVGSFITEFLDGSIPESEDDTNPVAQFKLAIDDLKAYYFEAATAQPGQESATPDTISSWFYRETVAGNVLHTVRNAHMDTEDKTMRLITRILLIPRPYSRPRPS
jgi:hypothetical protein